MPLYLQNFNIFHFQFFVILFPSPFPHATTLGFTCFKRRAGDLAISENQRSQKLSSSSTLIFFYIYFFSFFPSLAAASIFVSKMGRFAAAERGCCGCRSTGSQLNSLEFCCSSSTCLTVELCLFSKGDSRAFENLLGGGEIFFVELAGGWTRDGKWGSDIDRGVGHVSWSCVRRAKIREAKIWSFFFKGQTRRPSPGAFRISERLVGKLWWLQDPDWASS